MTTNLHQGSFATGIAPPDSVRLMLLERHEQLEELREELDRASTDGGKVVLIRGEAGIGKSALIREFLSTEADRAHVLIGYCDDLLTPHPFGPFWDIADQSTAIAEALQSDNRLGVMRATLDLLSRELRPTVIAIEDTQWADEATVDAVRYLGRRTEGMNGLLILTFRESEVDQSHPLRHVIGEMNPRDVLRVKLTPLSPAGVAALVAETSSSLDPGELYTMTDGNPLFTTELLASAKTGLPISIRDSLLARASKLSPRARAILDLVSVMPGEARRERALRLADAGEGDLAECMIQDLLAVNGEYVAFRHELTRRAIESALDPRGRRELNDRVLADLSVEEDLARLVHHAREARNVKALLQLAPKAARRAIAVGSYHQAASHFRALQPYLQEVEIEERRAIYDNWATAESYLDTDAVEILELFRHATSLHRQVGDEVAVAKSVIMEATFYARMGELDEADRSMSEALRILESREPSDDLVAALGRQGFMAVRRGDYDGAIQLADRSMELAEQLGDGKAPFSALNLKGLLLYDDEVRGLDLLEKARQRAVASGDVSEEVRALSNSGLVLLLRREFDLAIELLERGIEKAQQASLFSLERYSTVFLAKTLLYIGDWDRAEDLLVDELTRSYSNPETPDSLHILARIAMRKGHPNAQDLVEEVWANTVRSGTGLHPITARAEWMWLSESFDGDEARSLRQLAGNGTGGSWDDEVLFWLWMAGDQSELPVTSGPYALVMRGEAKRAAEQWGELGMPYERAVSLVMSEGTECLEGLEQLESLGARATARRCRKLLRDRGVSVPRGRSRETREHPIGLTARQDEVLQLLAEDLSDAEIADRLFVSKRTVNHHVSAILGKLSVSTRKEAAERADALGLLT